MVTPSGTEKIFRRYMKEKDFELTHHSDYRYPKIEPHYHEFCELVFFINGNVNFIIEDQIYHLENGDIILVPPNVLHSTAFVNFDVPYERFVLWFSLDTLKQLELLESGLGYFLTKDTPKRHLLRLPRETYSNFFGDFLHLEKLFSSKELFWKADVKAFLIRILTAYNRSLLHNDESVPLGISGIPLTDILTYIHQNIEGNLSLETVADHFFLNKYNLSRMFKKFCGVSLYQYVLQQRLLVGKELILNGTPAVKASQECGFKDYSNFYRAFVKEYEITPSCLIHMRKKKILKSNQYIP